MGDSYVDVSQFLAELMNPDTDYSAILVELRRDEEKLRYQGLNNGVIAAQVIQNLVKNGINGKDAQTRAIMQGLEVYNTVGARMTGRRQNRTSKEGLELYNNIVARLGIETTATGEDLKPTTVTFPRLASAFPVLYVKITQSHGRVVGKVIEGLPKALHMAIGASVIPHSYVNLFYRWCLYTISFDEAISRDGKDAENAVLYGVTQWNSQYVDDDTRRRIMRKLGVNADVGALSPEDFKKIDDVVKSGKTPSARKARVTSDVATTTRILQPPIVGKADPSAGTETRTEAGPSSTTTRSETKEEKRARKKAEKATGRSRYGDKSGELK